MRRSYTTVTALAAAAGCFGCIRSAEAGTGGWLDLDDQTSTRLLVDSSLGSNDTQEKDYHVGDVDQDGDTDVVVVRKQPFTSTGKRVNLFLMNENGVLVDRTTEYASASDVGGDNGFDTAANDRDVLLHDLNNDGWLDIVTATTLTDNQAKHMSHPRIYINLGEDGGGNWLGWEYQDARIPQMHATAGPRFCSVAAGDVTGDGHPDLVFGDYDSGGSQIFDYNNKLLINDGNGFFTDQTNSRWNSQMRTSAFGASSEIHDINGDGVNDVVKQTSLDSPTHVAVIYNNPANEGFFNFYDTVDAQAPYFVEVGDLNNDGLLDLVVVDDGTDKYYINTGNDGSNHANFQTNTFASSGGFGGNSLIADLDNDGWNDVIITDVDVDIPGCNRTTMIRRNLGGTPGGTPSFSEEGGSSFPSGSLNGVHDVAILDIDGDSWLDLIVGRCSGTQVYMNIPPDSLLFSYPTGVPRFLTPNEDTVINTVITSAGSPAVEGSGKLFLSVDNTAFQEYDMNHLGNNTYEAVIPGDVCGTQFDFYFQGETEAGGHVTDPANPAISTFEAISATGLDSDRNEFEDDDDVTEWVVTNSVGDNGGWERVDPNITFFFADEASPELDATQGEGVKAFVTQNAVEGNTDATASDVDGGPHYLTSPTLDLDGTDAIIEYARWFFSEGVANDTLIVEVSNNNGATWVPVADHQIATTNSSWDTVNFYVGDYVEPTSQVQVRFGASDTPNDSVTEAGIDNFTVRRMICPDVPNDCPTDTDGNGATDVDDLVAVILAWGTADPAADVNDSGLVDVDDLVAVILQWGACE